MNKDILIEKNLVNNSRKIMIDCLDNIDDIDFFRTELKGCLIEKFSLQDKLKEKNKIIKEISQVIEKCKKILPDEYDLREEVEEIIEILERGESDESKID